MAKDNSRAGNGIFGDIDPAPEPESPRSGEPVRNEDEAEKPRPAGSGAAGDTVDHGTGGSRNYHSNTGAAGSDIGNRPE